MGVVSRTFRALDLLLAPPLCPACEEALASEHEDGRVCPKCDAETARLPERRCALCGAPLDTFLEECSECVQSPRVWTAGTCAFPYDGPAGDWIRAYKYGGRTAFAPFFAREMAAAWKAHRGFCRPEVVVPIPLHWTRRLARGFNQSALLAQMLASMLGMKYAPALKRIHATAHQARLAGSSRLQNLRRAFAVCDADAVRGRCVLVVDDVFTTGATFTAACQVLLEAGAAETAVLAIARS